MSFYKKIGVLCLVIVFFFSPIYASEKIRVTFINPSFSNNDFWETTIDFMQAAAEDLGIEVKIYHANMNRYNQTKFARQVANAAKKPDYIVINYVRQQTKIILKIIEQAQIKTIIFNSDIMKEDRDNFGRPREKFKYWIGHIFPNDKQAGYDLANILIHTAQQNKLHGKDGKVGIIGISGKHQSSAAFLRNEGLKQAAIDLQQNLHQIVFAKWNRQVAAEMSFLTMKRYPDASVFWTASDLMALGIIEAIQKNGKLPGKQLLTGGVDWMPDALKAIQSGQMTASVGGHFMEGGWVMVMLYDYHHGRDFAKSEGLQMNSKMGVIYQDNVHDYLKRFGERNWDQIDFQKFSKVHNSNLKKYNFSLEAILNQLKQ